jgi:DNA-binding NarL/FixJ family response regulator
MSLKLQYPPPVAGLNVSAEPAPARSDDTVVSRIHQIRMSAEQICVDAADIEDARFLAENIIDACCTILANGHETATNFDSTTPGFKENADSAKAMAAAEKLSVLTDRELEIFTHLAEGFSAADISTKLSRSGKTINNHRTRILHKLGLRNATELVRLAVSAGLVSI